MEGDFEKLRAGWFEWETLRVVYNALMILQGVIWLVALRSFAAQVGHGDCYGLRWPRLVMVVGAFFLAANLFYCVGPLLETFWWVVLGRTSSVIRRGMVAVYFVGTSCYLHRLGGWAWQHVGRFTP